VPYHIDELLKKAHEQGASDLHITVHSPPIYRINGELSQENNVPVTEQTSYQMAKQL